MLIDSTKRQMIAVAAVACGFAVGMAGLLNYFKYRSTSNRIITERLVVTGRSVETVVQLALDLGLEFSEISTLPATLERERTTDDLITGIDIFDNDGKLLYSTETQRSSRPVPVAWLEAAAAAHGKAWMVEDDVESAAGMSLKTSFGVTLAHLALRYSGDSLRVTDREVAREIALNALIVFLSSALLSSLALLGVMRRLTLDMNDAEAVLRSGDAVHGARGPFGAALVKFIRSTHDVEREIADLSARAEHGAKP